MRGIASLGASTDDPSRGDTLPLPRLPSGSINTGRAPLESGDLAETVRDRVTLGFFLFFLCSIAAFLGAVVAAFRAVWG